MRPLIISSSLTAVGIAEKIQAGSHPRIDYLELAERMGTDYIDFNRFERNDLIRRVENKLRLDFRQAIWVASQIRLKKYDAVLSMSERIAIPLALLLPRSLKQVVIGHHLVSPHKLRFVKWMGIARRWDTIIAPTRAEEQVLKDNLYGSLHSLEHVCFPVDTTFFKPGPSDADRDADHILSVGLSYRDYPTLIAALRKVPNVVCQLRIGSAWVSGRTGIENEILPDNVMVMSFVPLLELLRCYEQCRFVVIPICRTTQWSAGSVSVLLAQAMGKPVIVTCTPGMRDYVREGETGLMVEMSNPDAMAEAIDYLWKRPDLARAMGRRAREWAVDKFPLEKWTTRMSEILNHME